MYSYAHAHLYVYMCGFGWVSGYRFSCMWLGVSICALDVLANAPCIFFFFTYCFTCKQTILLKEYYNIRDGEAKLSTSTFTQLLSFQPCPFYKYDIFYVGD